MRLLVLSRRRFLYSTRRLRESAARRGHEVRIVDPLGCTLLVDGARPRLFQGGRELGSVGCAIPRIGAAVPRYAVAVVHHLESMGIPVVNRSGAILRARDKLLTLQLLSRHGLDVPRTAMARAPEGLDRVLARVGGPPVVLKLDQGTQGVGVILAETRSAVEATLETLWGLGQNILVQEFVAESRGRDIRAMVVGGEVVAAMRRQARVGEWRSNVHRGARAEPVELDPAFARAAIAAAEIVGLDLAGVDLLEGRNGPRVMEVNASPGLEGLERATGVDVAERIVRHAEACAGDVGASAGEDEATRPA